MAGRATFLGGGFDGGGSGMAIGGKVTGGTTGSVLFIGASSVLAQDNAKLFWDDSNDRLGIGTATPSQALDVSGSINVTGSLTLGTELSVGNGGTGASTLTANGVLIGNGASAISAVDMSTKGNILIGDGSGSPQMLGIGTNTYVLTADSTETTGVKWAAAGGGGASDLNALDDVSILGSSITWSFFKNGDAIDGAPATGTFSGVGNLAIGGRAMDGITTGGNNIALGTYSLSNCLGGGSNFAAGYNAQFKLQSGTENIGIGHSSLYLNVSGAFNIALGTNAGYYVTGTGNILLGSAAGKNTTGSYNVVIGHTMDNTLTSTSSYNVLLGHKVKPSNSAGSRQFVVGNAHLSPYYLMSGDFSVSNQAKLGINLGGAAGSGGAATAPTATLHVKGQGNTVSSTSLLVTDKNDIDIIKVTDNGNILLFKYSNSSTEAGIAIGEHAGNENSVGNNAVVIGYWAGKENDAAFESMVAVGAGAAKYGSGHTQSILIGNNAGRCTNSTNANPVNNVMIGHHSGYNTSGDGNVFLGWKVGEDALTGDNNIFIGKDIQGSTTSIGSELNIGGNIIGSMAAADRYTKFTGQTYSPTSTLTSSTGITPNFTNGNTFKVTLAHNTALANPTNPKDGATYIIIVTQDGTGSRTMSYGTNYKWVGGTEPTLSTAAGAVDILTFISDGTNMYGTSNLNFS